MDASPSPQKTNGSQANISIVYDGECPFCHRFVTMRGLQKQARVTVINARVTAHSQPEQAALVQQLKQDGYDLNQGMVTMINQQRFYGADALHAIALLTEGSGLLNAFTHHLFKYKALTVLLYPLLKTGRNISLKLLGKPQIPY